VSRSLGFDLRLFDLCLIHQHDRDVVLDGIHSVALRALQALGILPVFERLLARRTNQNFQQILGNHDKGIVLKIASPRRHSRRSARPAV
jgi:hypothetical protein